MNNNSIILFEPNCRGSRAQILANTISAICKNTTKKIVVVTRSNYHSIHLDELLSDYYQRVEFFTANTDLDDEWITILTMAQFSSMLTALDRATNANPKSEIVFMALDEYLAPLCVYAEYIRLRFSKHPIYIIKYRVEYLLANHGRGFRNYILNILTRWTLFRLRAQFICFDERFNTSTVAGKAVSILPDPWFGDYSPFHRVYARNKYGFAENIFIILLVGHQNRRKGFGLVMKMAPELLKHSNTCFFIVGKIDDEYYGVFNALKHLHPQQIRHISNFVDEADLPFVFASADVFLLPYAYDFTASSGTLPRAAASCVPVIASSHGLVGYRVSSYGLGEVFDASNSNSLLHHILSVRDYTNKRRIDVSGALSTFAASNNILAFEREIIKILFGYCEESLNNSS